MVKKDTKMSEVKIGDAKKTSPEDFGVSEKVLNVASSEKEKCASDSGCCSGKRRFFSLRNVFFFIVVGLFITQYVQFQTTIGNLSFLQTHDDSLITEVGQLKGILTKIGGDLNQVREYIGMPVTDYSSSEYISDLSNDESKNTNRLQLALFQYVDYLSKKESTDTNLALNKSFLEKINTSAALISVMNTYGLSFSKLNDYDTAITLSLVYQGQTSLEFPAVFFYISKEDGKLLRKTLFDKKEVSYKDSAEFFTDLVNFINANGPEWKTALDGINKSRTAIESTANSESVQAKLAELKVKIDNAPTDKDFKYTYSVTNMTSDAIGEIVIDFKTLEVSLINKADNSSTTTSNVKTDLLPFIEKLDTRTSIEKKAKQVLEDMKNTLTDKGFTLALQTAGLKISEPREDEDRYYFDLMTTAGKVLSAIVVEKTTGVVNIVAPDGTNSENLLFFEPDSKKKTLEIPKDLSSYAGKTFNTDKTFNVLIAGKNGSLTDTMIFAHLDESTKEIKMISIPRDLFYNNRKINAYAYMYGMPELKSLISKLTGYKLDKYIVIDMYAFIDVIDLIGGVDIHLDKAVVDPTYKTIDNGVVGTLHYEPGDYHLGGKESLRLARSRHTTSDFARAERQQMIIEAIQKKAQNFGFGDADTVYQIAKAVLGKTETDISLDEAIKYYFKYQNYKIVSNDVMSSGNIFFVPPYITKENCAAMIESGGSNSCEGENHAYTLLPLDQDWDIIKWFFHDHFESE
ncbi:MAG: LCP family protein [Candidatus Peregrinibacteria bacterium]|nr:LCP family protein [Candidatus Peregrinibacteria bacterium]